MKTPNLRTQTFSTSSGKNVKSTNMLKGEAQKTPAESETNRTTQDYFSQKPSGPFGGRNTGS